MKPLLVLLVLAGAAAAEHDHGAQEPHDHAGHSFAAALAICAAAYDSMLFSGDYQGLAASVRWSHGRFQSSASVSTYRLTKNGKTVRGRGDAMAHGQVTLVARGAAAAGLVVAVMIPTGDDLAGLGMGHAMAMPGTWASWSSESLTLSASLGYGHGFGDRSIHAEHGPWPLVDPMNFSEVTFGGGAAYVLAMALRTGIRLTGAVPVGDGETRLIGGVRTVWTEGRVETAFEIQTGLVGDPFSVRGMLETAIRFE
jgi:hypothetical protein